MWENTGQKQFRKLRGWVVKVMKSTTLADFYPAKNSFPFIIEGGEEREGN